MRVVLVTNSLIYGGAERIVEALAAGLTAAGDTVHVVATMRDGPLGDALRARGIPVSALHRRGIRDLRAVIELRAICRQLGADILHSHIARSDLAAAGARLLGGRARTIATVHGAYVGLGSVARAGWHVALRTFDRVLAVSDWVRTTLPSRLTVQVLKPSVVDPSDAPDRERARARLGLPADVPVVMAVGRLVPVKGFDVLARAAEQLQTAHARVLVIGDGAERARLLSSPRIELLGTRADAAALIAAADVAVAPSRSDGFPQALLEAMAAGVPVVATHVGGIPELVVPGVTGLLVPPEDPAALARAIDALLTDRARAASLGAAGHARLVAENLTRSAMVERTRGVYAAVLGRGAGE